MTGRLVVPIHNEKGELEAYAGCSFLTPILCTTRFVSLCKLAGVVLCTLFGVSRGLGSRSFRVGDHPPTVDPTLAGVRG